MRQLLALASMLAAYAPAASADLRFTTHLEVRRTTTDSSPAAAELAAVLNTLMRPGDTRTFVAAGFVRIEQAIGTTPTVVLIRPDGQFILYPDSQTYLKIPRLIDALSSAGSASTTFARTGEFATLLGLRSERVLATFSITVPTAPPPGFPTRISLEGEIWLADAYRSEGEGLKKAVSLPASLPNGLDGLVMRQRFRNEQLGFEIESRVSDVSDGPIAAEMFEVPAGYRQVDQPPTSNPPPAGLRRR